MTEFLRRWNIIVRKGAVNPQIFLLMIIAKALLVGLWLKMTPVEFDAVFGVPETASEPSEYPDGRF